MKKETENKIQTPETYKGNGKENLTPEAVANTGRVNGSMNQPPSTDIDLDYFQQKVINHFRDKLEAIKEQTIKALQEIRGKARVSSEKVLAFSASAQIQGVQAAIQLPVATYNHLEELAKENVRREKDWKVFRVSNQLARQPIIPKNRINLYLQIILVVILESAFNGGMFSEGSSYGLIGGILIACLISGINVSTALITGALVLRYKNHVRKDLRLFGFLGTAVAAVIAFLFHLATARYRDHMASISAEEAGQSIASTDLSFAGIALLVVGLIIWIVGVFKGYYMSDPYPGYDRVSRKLEEAKSNYKAAEEEALNRTNVVLDAALVTYQESLIVAEKSGNEFKELLSMEQEVLRRYSDSVDYVNQETAKYLRLYREANMGERSTPPPAYFSKFPTFFSSILSGSGAERIDAKLAKKLADHVHAMQDRREAFGEYVLQLRKEEPLKLNSDLRQLKRELRPPKEGRPGDPNSPFNSPEVENE